MSLTIKAFVTTKKGNSFEVLLPAKRIVCWACEGAGTELRGGLKGAVISDENLADPDFRASYFGGDYDVPCSECKGRNVVDVVDEDALTKKMAERYWRAVEDKDASDRERAAEQRWFSRGCA
jgi:hypothetical protein